MTQDALRQLIGQLVDVEWYAAANPDVRDAAIDPLTHYIHHGAAEGRDPNRHFSAAWYAARYPDVAAAGLMPILHYMDHGAAELRDPHPDFDAAWYVDAHPAAAPNPVLFHMLHGVPRNAATRRASEIGAYLPASDRPLPGPPDHVRADIVIPVYKGLADTRACLDGVLADTNRMPGRVIVIDDASPNPGIAALLDEHARAGRITLVRHPENRGFVHAVNAGMEVAGTHDVILLNSDTLVAQGWTRRLAAHAYAAPNIASVSPFSNNATICGYPSLHGSAPAFGLPVAALDQACAAANSGRSPTLPVTVGFCMYVRRAALLSTGAFDAARFGRGYGEESDFCVRARALGWEHRLAADVYVHHTGKVSFGADAPEAEASQALLAACYPGYPAEIARHVRLGPADPARFAITAAVFRASGLPVVAFVVHALGGGVRLHADRLASRLAGRAHILMIEAGASLTLSVPHVPGHPSLTLAAERVDDLATLLRGMGVTRVHLHHAMGASSDLRRLLSALALPFDVTIHDWFVICPQVNLLPQLDQGYCGEPAPAVCDACIRQRPGNDAADILSWRTGVRWMLEDAARVLVPSEDARARLARHGITERVIVVPHEPVPEAAWDVPRPPLAAGDPLRVLLLGVLADQKGARVVEDVARIAGEDVSLHLVGEFERAPDAAVRDAVSVTGRYDAADAPALIAEARAHVAWFPAPWPETYSYTLSEALAARLPIIATRIGAFPERLAGRPLTWLLPANATPAQWLAAFAAARAAIAKPSRRRVAPRPMVADFYGQGGGYLDVPPNTDAGRHRPRDLRRAGRLTLIVIPERLEGGDTSPCGYIRLLLPLTHPKAAAGLHIVTATAREALQYRADAVVTQRYAVPSAEQADALSNHCRAHGMRLLYDLDDDLLHIPDAHPEAAVLRPRASVVRRMLALASIVTVSTETLRAALAVVGMDAVVIENASDERIWAHRAPSRGAFRDGPLRLLLMGTQTHDADLAMIAPALASLRARFGTRVEVSVIGMTAAPLPDWARRIDVPASAGRSYPAFVSWLTAAQPFHVGLVPLADTPFNACKSTIKTLDCAALGLPVLASDVPAYRGSLAAGDGGALLPPDPAAWHVAVAMLLRDHARWRTMADAAYAGWMRTGTLAAQAATRAALLHRLLDPARDAGRDTAAA